MPEPDTIEATDALLVVQEPPELVVESVIVEPPSHTAVGPVMAAGSGFTVMAVLTLQPVGNV